MGAPKQITIRNPSPALAARLKEIAEARNESVNTTALRLLEKAAGLNGRRARFERYATYTEAEADALDAAIRVQRTVDEKLWTEEP